VQSTRKRKKKKVERRDKFTEGYIRGLTPRKTRTKYWDSKVTGLLVEVMTSGAKIHRFRRTVNNKIETETIGNCNEVSLDQARASAVTFSGKIVRGESLKDARAKAAAEPTLEKLFELYFTLYVDGERTTAAELKKEAKGYWGDLYHRRVSAITTLQIQEKKAQLAMSKDGKTHKHRANKALDLLKAAYKWGVDNASVKENVAKPVKNFKTSSRKRIIEPFEFGPLLKAINKYSDTQLRDFFLMCLFTGQRSGKVMSMRREDISFEHPTWLIEKDKNGDANYVPLTEDAFAVLKARYKDRGTIPWVFPGGQSHKPTGSHLKEPKTAWKNILLEAEKYVIRPEGKPSITTLRIHDLRRSMGSYAAMSGQNTPVIMQMLGHKSAQGAAPYQRVFNSAAKIGADTSLAKMRAMSQQYEQAEEHRIVILEEDLRTANQQ
jgi:integrase